MKAQKIGVIGCGWLGFPLADRLQSTGFQVFGTTTQADKLRTLSDNGIDAHLYRSSEDEPPEWLSDLDVLFITLPPNKSSHYVDDIHRIVLAVKTTCLVIYTSSTGIYLNDAGGVVDEESPVDEHGVLFQAERVLAAHERHMIFRLGGLIGDDRHPIKYMSGKTIGNGNWPVNLVQREDVLAILGKSVQSAFTGIFNVVFPDHPDKASYYLRAARLHQLPPPSFVAGENEGKIVSSEKLERAFGYKFQHSIG
jgi:nucleoside-diphosphate-sugar epimerase